FWSLFYAAIMVAAFAIMGPNLIGLVSATEQLEKSGTTPTLEDFAPLFQMMGVMFAVLLPLSLIASAMIYAAISRSVLRPAESAFGYLRLGIDEFRVLVVSVVLFLVFMALTILMSGIIGAVIGMTVAAEMPALWLLVVLLVLAAIAVSIWLSVRLSLAIPITMAEKRIAIFDSFALTRGRFWPLLGMAVLAGVLSMVVGLLGSMVAMPLQMVTGGGMMGLEGLEGENLQVILQAAWPAIAVWILINAVMSALQVAVVYAPFSAAYRDMQVSATD
ncbi:MAG: hypothetical protein KAY29_01380, partial [Brevundimonas sp.]|nr:hypothetical protein [Brevundimonas sp.]